MAKEIVDGRDVYPGPDDPAFPQMHAKGSGMDRGLTVRQYAELEFAKASLIAGCPVEQVISATQTLADEWLKGRTDE